jgi:CBS domain containing-hemolysin-like protein
MSNAELAGWAALALVGLGGSAMCSGLETGFYCLSRVRLDLRLSRPGDAAARRVRRELEDPSRLLATILLGNNLCNYIGTLGVTALLEASGLSAGLTVLLQVLVLTPMLLVFGESLPKEFSRLNADTLPYRLSWAVVLARWAATATLVLPGLMVFARLVAGRSGSATPALALDGQSRLLHLLEESAHSGAISGVQGELAERALHFERSMVGDVMVPWNAVDRLQVEMTLEQALEVASRTGRSRLPVVDRRGRVVGVVHTVDLYRGGRSVAELIEEPARLDPREGARRAIGRLAENSTGLGIVEFHDKPVGVVTEHDLAGPLLEGPSHGPK